MLLCSGSAVTERREGMVHGSLMETCDVMELEHLNGAHHACQLCVAHKLGIQFNSPVLGVVGSPHHGPGSQRCEHINVAKLQNYLLLCF